jgi:hypothetical protein
LQYVELLSKLVNEIDGLEDDAQVLFKGVFYSPFTKTALEQSTCANGIVLGIVQQNPV